ncbi:hypothetical protein MnTg02_00802 [bacterium MnTg02]|nr:hypothetical protein MnTg02_00802 [bacterium MnTg02]
MKPSIIGPGLSVTGNVISKGKIQIEGEIHGDVHCVTLTVGENGYIIGGVVAEEIVVQGRVIGVVRGINVSLRASSHVEGDIIHTGLAIEQGAFFEGKIRRTDNPIGQSSNLDLNTRIPSADGVVTPMPRRRMKRFQ